MYSTGCPPNHVPLFDFEFLSALKALEAMSGHFSTAHSTQISKTSLNILSNMDRISFVGSVFYSRFVSSTGCPPNHVPLFDFEFLGALETLEAINGHDSTAHSTQISKTSLILSFDQCLTDLFQIYCGSPINEDSKQHLLKEE